MKTIISAIALALLCVTAGAQQIGVQGTNVDTATASTAAASNSGNNQAFNPTLMFNEAAANPFQSQLIHYSGTQTVKTVPNVVAAGLVATPSTCLGSRSAGGSVVGVGATGASTYEDDPCNGREGAKVLHVMGMSDAAIERLCAVSGERQAIENGFAKSRARWTAAANKARAEGRELPELKAVPRCKIDQDTEDANEAIAAAQRRQVSTSMQVPPATLAAAGVVPAPR
jgi:hypothetical protein